MEWGGCHPIAAHDQEIDALLLERCDSGHHLAGDITVDPLEVLCDLLPQLWKPVDAALAYLSDFPKDTTESVLWVGLLPRQRP